MSYTRTATQLEVIYRNASSHDGGLAAVYRAGVNEEVWLAEQRHAEEDQRVNVERARVLAARTTAEAEAAKSPDEKQAAAEKKARDERNAAEIAEITKARNDLAEKRRLEDEKRANERVAAVATEAKAV